MANIYVELQRTPLGNHAASHASGGSDSIKLDDLAAPDDNVDLNVSISKHGLCPKLDNVVTNFLNGQGGWSAPVAGAHAASHQNGGGDEISVAGLSGELADNQPPKAHASDHQSGGGDAIKLDDLSAPDDNTDLDASATKHGLLPKLSNVITEFLNGQGAWSAPAGGTPSPRTSEKKTDNYPVVSGDGAKTLEMSAGVEKTFTLDALATLGAGWWATFVKGDASKLNIAPQAGEVIEDGGAGDPIYNDVAAEAGMANITLQVDHDESKFIIIRANKTWVTTD